MSHRSKPRRRAVRLTPEAVELLQSRLTEVWKTRPSPGRLTREARADLLGVSVITADKILKNGRVDRSSLQLAFANLGLEWKDSFCQFADLESALDPLIQTRVKERSPKAVLAILGTALAVSVAAALIGGAAQASAYQWQHDFQSDMVQATDAYHRGDYAHSLERTDRAIGVARKYRDAAMLSDALRMKGELLGQQGDWAAALDHFERSLNLIQSVGFRERHGSVLEVKGNANLRLGRLKGAAEDYKACLKLAREFKNLTDEASALRGLGTVAAKVGDRSRAIGHFRDALQILGTGYEINMAFDVRARLALVKSDEGHHREALAALEDCLDHWLDKGHPRWIATTRLQLASVYFDMGEISEARQMVAASHMGFQAVGDASGVGDCAELLARLK